MNVQEIKLNFEQLPGAGKSTSVNISAVNNYY